MPDHQTISITGEITHFFAVYKELEEKETEVLGWQDRVTAYGIINEARRRLSGYVAPAEKHDG